MQVKATLLQKFLEVEQTAKEQAADNAILDQLHKVISFLCHKTICRAFLSFPFIEISLTGIKYVIVSI